ncbi:MAG: 6,7-dimethyl-8-ribityllumazine synthase, partial [Desulfobacteraceae bacterium]|nr:6,7-dimethyl-8-ribityllumazine synthase [Desulfobacteraceae bacterium]
MPKIIEGKLTGTGKRFAIVAARFNDFITDKLVGGAVDALVRSG